MASKIHFYMSVNNKPVQNDSAWCTWDIRYILITRYWEFFYFN